MTIGSILALAFFLLLLAATYVLGTRYGTRIGAASAVLVASAHIVDMRESPSDALAPAACWVASLAAATGTRRGHALLGGLLGGIATWVWPALTPIGLLVVVFLLLRPERPWNVRVRGAIEYAVPCALGLLAPRLHPLVHEVAAGSGGIGAVSTGIADGLVEVLPLLLIVATLWLLPGALTTLLLACAVVSALLSLAALVTVDRSSLLLVGPAGAIALILLMAAIDAIWRRRRLPKPAVVVAVAAVAIVILQHVR